MQSIQYVLRLYLPVVPSLCVSYIVCIVLQQPPAKYLLPEMKISDYGKKCVVIDLDETLVHSSFKVSRWLNFVVSSINNKSEFPLNIYLVNHGL